MKTILLIFTAFFISLSFGQIEYETSLEIAFKKAKEQNKYVFIKYYSENCSHCKELETGLKMESVYTKYTETFVCYKMEIDNLIPSEDAFIQGKHLFIEFVPMMLFFDPNGNFVHYYQPKTDEASLLRVITNVFSENARTMDLPVAYKNGDREVVNLKMYSKYAQLQRNDSLVDALANDIFTYFPQEQLVSVNSVVSVAKYVKSIQNGFFKFWMENYFSLNAVEMNYSLADKQKVFTDILSNSINREKAKWNLEQIETAKRYIKITDLYKNVNTLTWMEESILLFKNEQDKEALEVGKTIILDESIDFYTKIYALNFYRKNASKSGISELDTWFSVLSANLTDKEQIYTLKCNYALFCKEFKKSDFETAKKDALSYAKDNSLEEKKLEEVLKN